MSSAAPTPTQFSIPTFCTDLNLVFVKPLGRFKEIQKEVLSRAFDFLVFLCFLNFKNTEIKIVRSK